MPYPLELPRMRRAVVPLVRPGNAVVGEVVANCLPALAAVVRPLHHLSEPRARLRRIDTVWINRRSLDVINLPPGEVRPAHLPLLALAVRRQHKRTFLRSNQHSNLAHKRTSSIVSEFYLLALCLPLPSPWNLIILPSPS